MGSDQGNANWTVDSPDIVHYKEGKGLPRYMQHPWTDKPVQASTNQSGEEMSVDEQTPRPFADPLYAHPEITLPQPGLKYEFRMCVKVATVATLGATPSGNRRFMSFAGGTWTGSFGSGIVAPGGQATQIMHDDLTDELETSYLLQTNDERPAFITVKSKGFRTGPAEVLRALNDPKMAPTVDPNTFKGRLVITMETGDERYKDKVNYGMWIGSGLKVGMETIYDAYRVI